MRFLIFFKVNYFRNQTLVAPGIFSGNTTFQGPLLEPRTKDENSLTSSDSSMLPDVRKNTPMSNTQAIHNINPVNMLKFPTRVNSPTGSQLETIMGKKRKESMHERNLRGAFRSPPVMAMNAKLAYVLQF